MEAAKVLKMVHLLSERCLYDREVQRDGLKKMKEALERLKEVEGTFLTQSRLLGGWLNGTQGWNWDEIFPQPSAFAMGEDTPWLVLQMNGDRFENLTGLSVVMAMALGACLVLWLMIWAGRFCQRRRMRDLAQVTNSLPWTK